MKRLNSLKQIVRSFLLNSLCMFIFFACFAEISSAQYSRDGKSGQLQNFDKFYEALKNDPNLPTQIIFEINIFEVILRDTTDIGFVYDVLGDFGRIEGTNLAGDPNIESNLGVLSPGNRNELLPSGANIVSRIFEDKDGELLAIIQALAEDQVARIHANPIILAVAGVPVHLDSGDDIPYLERTSLQNNDTFASTYRKTGVNIELNSQIEYSETDIEEKKPFIRVTLNADLSSVTRYREEQGFAQPIVDTRNYSSTFYLLDNQAVLLAGLFKDSKGDRGREIPILRDIPLLGRLFRSTSTESTLSQFFIMIRPSIFDVWGSGVHGDMITPKQNFDKIGEILEKKTREKETGKSPFEEFREIFLDSSSVKK